MIERAREKKLGLITSDLPGIGDKLVVSSFPENYYHNTGLKVVDIDHCCVFDHNPFVERDTNYEIVLTHGNICSLFNSKKDTKQFLSFPERMCKAFGFKLYLRNPRLYKFDNVKQEKRICIHSSGSSKNRHIPPAAVEKILERYSDHEILQIGWKGDTNLSKVFPKISDCTSDKSVKDAFWDTAQFIASSEMYIGIDSGWVHMANAYNRVRKKIFLNYPEGWIEQFVPGVMNPQPHTDGTSNPWFDFNWEYYNTFNYDVGVSRSYLNI